MIESRLGAQTDGLSNVARVKEYTVAEIAIQFRYLAEEGGARAVSSILRIVREQTQGRRAYAGGPIRSMLVISPLVALFTATVPHLSGPMHDPLLKVDLGLVLLDVIAAIVLWCQRERRCRFHAQIAEIRRLALESLRIVVEHGTISPRSYSKEERNAFTSLRGADPGGWLQVAKALAGDPE